MSGFPPARLGLPLTSHSSPRCSKGGAWLWGSGRDKVQGGSENAQVQELLEGLCPALERGPEAAPKSTTECKRVTIKLRVRIFDKLRAGANVFLGYSMYMKSQSLLHIFIQQTFLEDLLCAR